MRGKNTSTYIDIRVEECITVPQERRTPLQYEYAVDFHMFYCVVLFVQAEGCSRHRATGPDCRSDGRGLDMSINQSNQC